MSYAGRKSRVFRDQGDIPDVIRRRSEGRLKSYPSVQDARTWVNEREDRRQQILDYINADIEKCSMGKYVPIDVLINTLLANKNADAFKLKNEVNELQAMLEIYAKLDLTEDQKRKLGAMKSEMEKAGNRLGTITGGAGEKGKCAAVKREMEGTSCAALDKLSQSDLKAVVIKKDAEIIALKNQLEAIKAELAEERGAQKSSSKSKPPIDEPCIKEIENLEVELQRLRSKGQLSADDEAEIIRKEIEVLKRYCTKLSSIQAENQKLKEQLGQTQSSSTVDTSSALSTDNMNNFKMQLNEKIAKLNEVTAERDKLKKRISVLETELLKYADLPKEIEEVKRRAGSLGAASIKSEDKGVQVDNAKDVQKEMEALKKKADQTDELQNKLVDVNNEIERVRRESAAEMENLKLKHEELASKKNVESKGMHEEIKCLSKCAQEAKALRRERDNLKGRLAQLSGIEKQFKQLQEKVKYLESIKKEREMYKMRYEELLGLECQCEILKAQVEKFKDIDKDREGLIKHLKECERCIASQEEEIKRLIAHIDRVSEDSSEEQALDFMDLKLLHQKTCEATAALLRASATQWGSCMCQTRIDLQLPEDKQILLKKINSLENELIKKEKHTQQKVVALQISVKMERERLQEFKELLNTERIRNNELMCKIGAQSRIVASMQAERDMMRRRSMFNEEKLKTLVMHCEDEKLKIKQLEEDLKRERELHKQDMELLMELQKKQYGSGSGGCHCSLDCRCKQLMPGDNQTLDQSTRTNTEFAYTQSQYSPHEVITRQTFMRQCCVKQRGRRRSSMAPEIPIKSPADLEDID